MSDTPRTNRVLKNCNGWHHVPIELARELERELNEWKRWCKEKEQALDDLAKLFSQQQDRINRLEEAGNELIWAFCPASVSMMTERESDALKLWNKAKEAKP